MSILQSKKYFCDQSQVIKLDKFTYSPFAKSLDKQTKAIEDQGKKLEALKV